jgi:saccharopine dehydrogenase-like NADP-dependent oxidoreductase
MHTVLVLGGYGFFGSRICSALALDPAIRVLVGGRSGERARAAAPSFGLHADAGVEVDANSADLARRFVELGIDSVVHAAGPFQGQDYVVARAAVRAGCHYLDLADGRAFVAGIESLNAEAVTSGVTVISGASSVPGLSSARLSP